MPRLVFAVPGDIEARTGGTLYDRRIMEALRADGWWVDLLAWPGSFPFPNEAERDAVDDSLEALPDNSLVLIDGLAFGVLSGLARREAQRLRLVALVHHPLALETGLSAGVAATFAASERDALACARAVIVTSQTTAAIVESAFGVPGELITVAPPGIEVSPPAVRAPRRPGPVRIFALGQIVPRKAHDVLIAALSRLKDLEWECVIAGDLERDPETAQGLKDLIDDLGLDGRVALVGEVSQAEATALYARSDIFALASLYEGFGMVFSEALAFGLPIVATTGGAIPEAVPEEAGILVAPGDVKAFAGALRLLIEDPERRAALAEGAKAAGAKLGDWTQTAALIASCLERI
jgi:glycosyltransferase involved in cell wall biosynthesis